MQTATASGLLAFTMGSALAADDAFLEPEQAFQARATVGADGRSVVVDWTVAPGYHLYADRLQASSPDADVRLGAITHPPGKRSHDPVLDKTVEKLTDRFAMQVPVLAAGERLELEIGSQGCAGTALCYPPQTERFSIVLPAAIRSAPQAMVPDTPQGDDETIARTLAGGSLSRIALLFLGLGVLLSFTPCVLPMVPILSSIIVGQREAVSRGRGLVLACAYSLGMALVYTALGVAAGLAGEGLAAVFQHPAVLGGFALLLVGLALSMFDVYQLQLPAGLQGRFAGMSDRLPGGRLLSVFGMGAISAMIVGPCVAAPLAGALVYISRTRDVAIGGIALFSMAAGMSVPLLLTGLSAGSLLPRAGAWMNVVKSFFGVLLLAVAIWMVSPALPASVSMLAWAALAIGCAIWLRVFDPLPDDAPGTRRLGKAIGAMLLLAGAMQAGGVAMGGDDPLRPLAPLAQARRGGAGGAAVAVTAHDPFAPVSDLGQLARQVAASGRPVLLDVYADWCVACKEMERFTFADPAVRERLGRFTLLRADVTRNDDAARALMKRFGLFGPPGIVFLNGQGGELPGSRVVGFREASAMVTHLDKVATLAPATVR